MYRRGDQRTIRPQASVGICSGRGPVSDRRRIGRSPTPRDEGTAAADTALDPRFNRAGEEANRRPLPGQFLGGFPSVEIQASAPVPFRSPPLAGTVTAPSSRVTGSLTEACGWRQESVTEALEDIPQ